MPTLSLAAAPTTPAPNPLARALDALAEAVEPWLAAALGYTFRVGTDDALARDAHAVLGQVWTTYGVAPPADTAAVTARYDRATTWIVAYHRGRAVGVLGLLDMRLAAVSLDYDRRAAPTSLDLERTRELGRVGVTGPHREGARVVMAGLLRTLARWCADHGVETLYASAKRPFFDRHAGRDPSARLVEPPPAPPEDALTTRYFAPLRAYGGPGVHYTFAVAGARPLAARFLAGQAAA